MEVKIKNMEKSDLPQVMEIEKRTFSTAWSEESFLRDLRDDFFSIYLSAYYDDQLVGYIGAWLVVDEIHITNLAVAKKYRNRRIGTKLIKELLKRGKKMGMKQAVLEVRISNQAAINLYNKLGFEKITTRPDYYRDTGEDALIMGKELKDD